VVVASASKTEDTGLGPARVQGFSGKNICSIAVVPLRMTEFIAWFIVKNKGYGSFFSSRAGPGSGFILWAQSPVTYNKKLYSGTCETERKLDRFVSPTFFT
jgi:hypothetical protein